MRYYYENKSDSISFFKVVLIKIVKVEFSTVCF